MTPPRMFTERFLIGFVCSYRTRVSVFITLHRSSGEKHEPASDIDTAVDSLKALDPKRPIRESGHSTKPM